MFISFNAHRCGKVWKATYTHNNRGKVGNLQIHKTRALVAWQGEDGSVHVGVDMLLVELLIETLHGALWRVVVFAEVAEHNVFDARMVNLCDEPRRLGIAQVAERT